MTEGESNSEEEQPETPAKDEVPQEYELLDEQAEEAGEDEEEEEENEDGGP